MAHNKSPPYRYKRVFALLVSWLDDELDVNAELAPLFDVFKEIYHFKAAHYRIPSIDCEKLLEQRLSSLSNILDSPDTLFILYYAGHGGSDGGKGLEWHPGKNTCER